ncbi:hypothetical protein H2203_001842 [Taxawa tesnikishii (nom. ined.)]|nr:hypothetical protein H2203_001842 [Dothideales sp. JES 119]
MKHVEERETEEGNKFGQQVDRSFYPLPYVQCPNGKKANDQRDDQGRERERCKYLPCHYFDYIGGTSTGGLISIMLGRLRLGVDECIEEYENLGQEVFGHPRLFSIRGRLLSLQEKYDEKRLQRVVNDLVLRRLSDAQLNMGASNFSSASSLCRTVVVAYEGKRIAGTPDYGKPKGEDNSKSSVDVKEGPCLFRSYDHWASPGNTPTIFERNPGSAHSIPLWQVARATSAAPTYFKPVKIQDRIFGDGGFGANNPTEELICEVSQMHGNDRKVIPLVVSIGTGGKPNPGRYEGDGIWKYINLIKAAKAIPTDSDDTGAARLCEVAKIPYFRFNVLRTQGLGEVKLDEWKTKGVSIAAKNTRQLLAESET